MITRSLRRHLVSHDDETISVVFTPTTGSNLFEVVCLITLAFNLEDDLVVWIEGDEVGDVKVIVSIEADVWNPQVMVLGDRKAHADAFRQKLGLPPGVHVFLLAGEGVLHVTGLERSIGTDLALG
jgi:hypothetical protein